MQCPDCGYISFKQEKACGSCGYKFKKSAKSSKLFADSESFSIFAGASATSSQAKEQESQGNSYSGGESVGVMDAHEEPSFIDSETGDFNLDLSEAQTEVSEEVPDTSSTQTEEVDYEDLEFDPDADIDLGEVEGLGLEPFDEPNAPETQTAETPEVDAVPEKTSDDVSLATDIAAEIPNDDKPIELELTESNPEEEAHEAALEIQEPEDPILPIEPELEINEPEELISPAETELVIDEPENETNEVSLEIQEPEELVLPTESELEIDEPESETVSMTPELDLGETEIKVDLDDEPSIPDESETVAPTAPETDELELNLEIDDSEGPLVTQNQEAPELEIEDLGLELESLDEPDKDTPKN